MARIVWDIFLSLVSDWLSTAKRQINQLYDSLKVIKPDEIEIDENYSDFRDEIADQENKNNIIMMNNSSVVIFWTAVELTLVEVCREMSNRKSIPHQLDIPKRDRLKSINKILIKEKIKIPKNVYDNLCDLEKIRNCVVHAYGLVEFSKEQKKLVELSRRNDWLSAQEGPFFTKSTTLLVDNSFLISLLSSFAEWIEKELVSKGFGPKYPTVQKS